MEKSKSMIAWRTLLVLFIALVWGGGIGAYAASKAWVKYTNGTLTFQYGEKTTLGTDEYWLNKEEETPDWYVKYSVVTKVVFDKSFASARPTSCSGWFRSFGNLTTIEGIENLNTSQVYTMEDMFAWCNHLTSLDLSNFITSNVVDMTRMFFLCNRLTTIYASSLFVTSQVLNRSQMFSGCMSLIGDIAYDENKTDPIYAKVDGGYFTHKVYTRPWVKYADGTLTFRYGYKKDLGTNEYALKTDSYLKTDWSEKSNDVTNVVFDPSFARARPTTCSKWFKNFNRLLTIEGIENLNTSNTTNMYQMFYGCSGLVTLDLSGFNTSNVTDMRSMFSGCSGLTTIYVSDLFVTSGVSEPGMGAEMFKGCTTLVGDIAYDADKIDKTYASADGGYFIGLQYFRPWAKYADGTLTFLYGYKKELDTDEYGLNENGIDPKWNEKRKDVTIVVFDKSFANARPTTCFRWFDGFKKLSKIKGIKNLKTDDVTNMRLMFYGCSSLTSLDLSNFNTSNVTNMRLMFCDCSSLTSLDLSNFNTSKVLDMRHMFYGCSSLTSLDLSNFNTSKVTDMRYMFSGCSALATIYASDQFVTGSVTDDANMFLDCTKLVGGIAYDANKVDKTYATVTGGYFTQKDYTRPWVKYADGTLTFQYSNKKTLDMDEYELNEYDTPGWREKKDVVTKVVFDPSFADARPATCALWFFEFSNLSTIEGIENFNTSEVREMRYMFYGCSKLESLDVSNFNTTNVRGMENMFSGCSKLEFLDVSKFNTSNVTDMSRMFFSCYGLTSLDLSNFNTSNVTNMSYMFYGCYGLTSLDVSTFNTSNVTNMSYMFFGCSDLEFLDVSKFNTSNVTNMDFMFKECVDLTKIYASDKFVTSSVTSSEDMFTGCKRLAGDIAYDVNKTDKTYATVSGGYFTLSEFRAWVKYAKNTLTFQYGEKNTLNTNEFWLNEGGVVPDWNMKSIDVQKVIFDPSFAQARPTTCFKWFFSFKKLSTISGSEYLNTSKVTDMSYMYAKCSQLKSLYVLKFDTQNVINMKYMFYGCSRLTSLDLSNFNISNVTNMSYMFPSSSRLKSIYLGDGFYIDKLESITHDNMFNSCPATLYCSPLQHEHFKGSSVIASAGNAVKPYVSINPNMEYGTLCVPVGSSLAEGSFTGFDKLYQVKDANKNKGTITLAEAKSIEPGVPYVYHCDLPKNAEKNVITFDVDADAPAAVTVPKNDGSLLKGTFESMIAPAGKYILQTDGNFHPVPENNTTLKVGAYRAYLDLSLLHVGYAKTYQIVFGDDETTGIDRINSEGSDKGIHTSADQQPKAYFDLMGRKVSAPQKGNIYIMSGKKVVYNK